MNALTPLGRPASWLPAATSRAAAPGDAFDLRALRYFAATARHGNLARAAQELGVTAPAISQQLRKLEDEIGTALLIRHGRGVTATPAGAVLLQRADAILRLLRAPLGPDTALGATKGVISLALPAEHAALLAAPLAARIRQGWPAATLELTECTDDSAEARLLRGQADIAVLPDESDLDALHIERVATEALGLVAAPGDAPGRSSLPLRLRDLAHVPLILPGHQHWIRRLLAKAAFQRGVALDVAFQADGAATAKAMVRGGLGCTVLPAASVQEEAARGALVFRPLEQPALAATHAIGIQASAGPAIRAMARAVADAMRLLAGTGAWAGSTPVEPKAARTPAHATAEEEPARLPQPEPLVTSLESVEGD